MDVPVPRFPGIKVEIATRRGRCIRGFVVEVAVEVECRTAAYRLEDVHPKTRRGLSNFEVCEYVGE